MSKYKKRKDGRYAVNVDIGYHPDGRRKRKTVYGKTIAELNHNLAEIRLQADTGHVIDDKNLTVGQWAVMWLKTYKNNASISTKRDYESVIKNHILTTELEHLRMQNVKSIHIQQRLNLIVDAGFHRTAEKTYNTLRQMFSQAVNNDIIYKDITASIPCPKYNPAKKRAISKEEIKWIEQIELSDKQRLFIYLALYCGLRRGEILSLAVNDIDIPNQTLKVQKNLVFCGNKSEIKHSPKTQAGFREIPIPEPLYSLLVKYLKSLNNIYLFTTVQGKLATTSFYKRFWDSIIDRLYKQSPNNPMLKHPKISAHILRHTYATNLFYAGVDLKTIQYLMGHSTIEVTLDIYTHFQVDNADVLEKISALRI